MDLRQQLQEIAAELQSKFSTVKGIKIVVRHCTDDVVCLKATYAALEQVLSENCDSLSTRKFERLTDILEKIDSMRRIENGLFSTVKEFKQALKAAEYEEKFYLDDIETLLTRYDAHTMHTMSENWKEEEIKNAISILQRKLEEKPQESDASKKRKTSN